MSEQIPVYYAGNMPNVQAVLASPETSFWLRESLQAALQRDPVDALKDAEYLVKLLASRCAEIQHVQSASFPSETMNP